MKGNMARILSVMTIVLFVTAFTYAQDSRVLSAVGDMYVISAKAGGVNFIEGKVAIARKRGKSGFLLKGDNIDINDRVSTGASGKTEILLNPGSYLRLAENSTFEFVSTELDNVQIKLNSGSAIFEVFADDEFRVAINTPKTNFFLIQTGVYRIDVKSDGSENIEVWKGRAQIGEDETNIVKAGKLASVNNGQPLVAKFDRDEKDDFEIWSQARAKELAKINSKLEKQTIKTSLINSFNRRDWNLYNSFGLWVYNGFYGSYCFLPFGYGWSSPYGYGYGYNFFDYRLPRYIYTQPPPNNQPTVGNNTQPNVRQIIAKPENHVPPFERVRGSRVREPINNDVFDQNPPARAVSPIVVAPPVYREKTRGN